MHTLESSIKSLDAVEMKPLSAGFYPGLTSDTMHYCGDEVEWNNNNMQLHTYGNILDAKK